MPTDAELSVQRALVQLSDSSKASVAEEIVRRLVLARYARDGAFLGIETGGNLVDLDPSSTPDPGSPATSLIWTPPSTGPLFDRAIEGLPQVADYRFGSLAAAGPTTPSVAITNAAILAEHFNPLQGVYIGGVHAGGAGPTTINSEPQRYRDSFVDSPNHVFETDCLRLQATLDVGSFTPLARGQIATGGSGVNFNAAGAASPTATAMADIGLTQTDIDNIPLGAVCNNGPSGLAFVVAKGTGTITLEAITGGARMAYTGNWHVTFMPWRFARVSAAVTNGTSTTATMATTVTTDIVGHWAYGAGSSSYVDPKCKASRKVLSVSGSTVTFDGAVHFDTLNVTNATSGGILFLPSLASGQINEKVGWGAHLSGKAVFASEIEFQTAVIPHYGWGGTGSYTKAAVEAALAAGAGVPWGCWPSYWAYPFREGNVTIPGGRLNWSELDVWEAFCHINRGPAVHTCNLHDQAYTRRRAMRNSSTLALNGWTWLASAATNKELTPNAMELQAPSGQGLCNGAVHTAGFVQTRAGVTHYVDRVPICYSDWPIDTEYPLQMTANLAMGALSSGNPANLFFPLSNSTISNSYLKVRRITHWQI